MSKIIAFLAVLSLLFTSTAYNQTVFTENIGTPSGTVAIAAHTFQNTPTYTFSGTADVRNTTTSTGYAGSSAGGNVFFTNTVGRDFLMSGINTTGYSSLVLSFGHFKSTTTGNNELIVETSPDGVTFTPLTYSRATGSGTATWTLITAAGTIPATANLRIRFRQSSASTQFRLDDIKLVGTIACSPAATPTTLASSFSAVTFCTSAQISFTAGNGAKRMAVVSTTNFPDIPTVSTAYTANTTYGSGSTVGAGNFTVLNGTGNSVTINGLTANTTYFIKVFEYNGVIANCDEAYLTVGVSSFSFTTQNNCATPQIRSILADACSTQEGLDELVIIENGANPLPISDITINFPSGGSFCNSGCGANTLLNNPAYIASLNALAGCSLFQYADPIPAGGIMVVFTGLTPSYVFDYSTQCPSSSTYYAVFCNNASTAGRFANSGAGTRTLDAVFGSDVDAVTYAPNSLLGDGSFVDFDAAGNPTYRQELNCIYPLGVEWGFFNAHTVGNSIELQWQTMSEKDADYFAIQRANYAEQFETIGTIDCFGNSTSPIDYLFSDRNPKSGINYYRIKQVDLNGEAGFSPTIAINHELNDLSVFYAAQLQQLIFSKTLKAGSELTIYQTNGQKITSLNLQETTNSIYQSLVAGIWLIEIIELNGDRSIMKLMVE